jgi:hypothetical protein
MKSTVGIVCFPGSAERYRDSHAIVVADDIRATPVATTAVSLGRRVSPAQTTDDASVIATTLKDPLLVGELGGNMPYGFDITNSPVLVAARKDVHRPMVLVVPNDQMGLATARSGASRSGSVISSDTKSRCSRSSTTRPWSRRMPVEETSMPRLRDTHPLWRVRTLKSVRARCIKRRCMGWTSELQ